MRCGSCYMFGAVALATIACNAWAEAGWTDYVSVMELTPTIHEKYTAKLIATDNPSGCKNKEWFYQNYDPPGSDLMYHTLLEALIAGKKVRIYVTGRCDLNGYSEFSSLSIVP